MKIKRAVKKPPTANFDSLKGGAVFYTEGGTKGELWLKNIPEGQAMNCVRLDDGVLGWCRGNEQVIVVEGSFVEE